MTIAGHSPKAHIPQVCVDFLEISSQERLEAYPTKGSRNFLWDSRLGCPVSEEGQAGSLSHNSGEDPLAAHIPQVCSDFLEISSIAPQLPLLIPIFLSDSCIVNIKKHSFFFPRSSVYTY